MRSAGVFQHPEQPCCFYQAKLTRGGEGERERDNTVMISLQWQVQANYHFQPNMNWRNSPGNLGTVQ